MKTATLQRAALALVLASALAACGGKDETASSEAADRATAAAPAADAATPQAEPAVDVGPLRVAELDAYARGMQHELGLLQAASDKVKQARAAGDEEAEASSIMKMAMLDTEVEGAKAAGLDQARYLFVKRAVDTALGKAEMQAAMKSMGAQAGVEDLPPEQRQQVEAGRAEMEASLGDPWQGMPADVAAAMQARQAELAQLRAQAIGLRMNAGG